MNHDQVGLRTHNYRKWRVDMDTTFSATRRMEGKVVVKEMTIFGMNVQSLPKSIANKKKSRSKNYFSGFVSLG